MREASLSYWAIAHRVGRNVTATVLRCCRAWFEDQCYRNFHRFTLVMAQLLYKIPSKYAISGCCIFPDK
jgi:hypothetical protein